MKRTQKLVLFIGLLISSQVFYSQKMALNNENQEISIRKEKALTEHLRLEKEQTDLKDSSQKLEQQQKQLKDALKKVEKRKAQIEKAENNIEKTTKDIANKQDQTQKLKNEINTRVLPEDKLRKNEINLKEQEIEILKLQNKLAQQQKDFDTLLQSKS